jgi:PAS domain-containing protein
MDKPIHLQKKAVGRKISLRIAAVYLLLACLFQIGTKAGFPYWMYSAAATTITACLLYVLVQRNLEAVRRTDAVQLEREETKIRSTLESIQDGYYEMDGSGHFLFFNHSLVDILGVTEAELHEKHFTDFMGKEDAQKLKQTFHWVSHTGTAINCVE